MKKTAIAIILLLLFPQIVFAAGDVGDVAQNAVAMKKAIVSSAKALKWIIALIPGVIIVMASYKAFSVLRSSKYNDGGGQKGKEILKEIGEITFSAVFAIASLFIVIGVFAKAYANGGGSVTFTSTWVNIVVSFWKGVIILP